MAIIANTTVIAGGKTYQAGQTVSGLSTIDKEWMLDAGYITEKSGRKEEKKAVVVDEGQQDEF